MPKNNLDDTEPSFLQETSVHIWKDLKLVKFNISIFILLTVILCFSCISAYSLALDYHREISNEGDRLLAEDIESLQNNCILEFWSGTLIIVWPIVFGLFGTLLVSQENEDDLIKYIFTFKTRSTSVYLSKLITLFFLLVATYLLFIASFQLIFYFTSGDFVDTVILAYATAYPMIGLLIIGMIGLFMASISKKRYTAFIGTLMFVFISYALSSLAWSEGVNAFDFSTGGPYEFDIFYIIVYLFDPMTLREGMLDVLGLFNSEGVFYQGYYQVMNGAYRCCYAISLFTILASLNVWVLYTKHRFDHNDLDNSNSHHRVFNRFRIRGIFR